MFSISVVSLQKYYALKDSKAKFLLEFIILVDVKDFTVNSIAILFLSVSAHIVFD